MIFRNIRTNFNFIFGQFSVARKFILNGGAIRPTGRLLNLRDTSLVIQYHKLPPTNIIFQVEFNKILKNIHSIIQEKHNPDDLE